MFDPHRGQNPVIPTDEAFRYFYQCKGSIFHLNFLLFTNIFRYINVYPLPIFKRVVLCSGRW